MWVSVPSALFREFDFLWMAQDSRRHRLEVWGQVLITYVGFISLDGVSGGM